MYYDRTITNERLRHIESLVDVHLKTVSQVKDKLFSLYDDKLITGLELDIFMDLLGITHK